MKSKSGRILVVAMSALFMALPVTEASAKMTKRDKNVAIGVGIGLGVLGAAIIASQGAKASPRRDRHDRDDGPRFSCRELKYMCRVEDREWACRKYRRSC